MRQASLVAATVAVLTSGVWVPRVAGQGPPGTDIYLVRVDVSGEDMRFSAPLNVTDRDGYDNQPSFTPDGRFLLYTSNRGGQTDIYRYDIANGTTTQVTHTAPESEYSPTVTAHGNTFSVVRVERDSTQRLWEFGLDGDNPQLVLADVAPVGYHAWGNAMTVALFVLGQPSTLRIADRTTGQSEIVAYNIGRSLHKIPDRNSISFAHRVSDDKMIVKELEIETRVVRPLAPLLAGNEFYAWTPDGAMIMGQGAKLFRLDPTRDTEWHETADLSGRGVDGISRIAVSPDGDWIAVVGNRPGS